MHRVAANKLIFNITFAWEHAVAITDENDAGKLVSHRFPQFSLSNSLRPEFLKYVILDENFHHHLYLSSPGGAGRNRVLKIDEALNYPIYFPSVEEQHQIGTFFSNLDNLITLHQREYEKLNVFKKSMLENCFPKNGEKVPKVRFSGFTGDWEQRKLGDILERRKTYQKISKDAPRLAFAAGQGVIPLSERKTNNRDQLIEDEKNKKYLLTLYNDIVYNPANLKYGAIDRNKLGKGVISPIYVTFTSSEVPSFIERIVTSESFRLKALKYEEGTVVKRQSVSPEALLSFEVMISPSKEEQTKIGDFFDEIDHLITLHQRKLDQLQKIKKSLLKQMFI